MFDLFGIILIVKKEKMLFNLFVIVKIEFIVDWGSFFLLDIGM